jgi:hypothetical protein
MHFLFTLKLLFGNTHHKAYRLLPIPSMLGIYDDSHSKEIDESVLKQKLTDFIFNYYKLVAGHGNSSHVGLAPREHFKSFVDFHFRLFNYYETNSTRIPYVDRSELYAKLKEIVELTASS